jgi:hypothetical protein
MAASALQGRRAFGAPAPMPMLPVGTRKKRVPPPKPDPIEEEEEAVAIPERWVADRGWVAVSERKITGR